MAALLPTLAIPDGTAPLAVAALFPQPVRDDVWLEIGFGAGEHLAAQAAAHPDIGFIGAEPFENGVAALLARVQAESLANVRVFADDARLLMARLPDASIGRLFVLFPDPWPKARHHKRRMVGPTTLPEFARILKDGGELRFASDDADYAAWVLEYAARYLAKNVVAAGLAERCTIQLAYAIGVAQPLSVYVDTEGTGQVDEEKLSKKLQQLMDLTPRGIRTHLKLNRPIYARTAAYGHFGRQPDADGGFSWEKTDIADKLRAAF